MQEAGCYERFQCLVLYYFLAVRQWAREPLNTSTLTSVNKESNGGYPKGEALGSIQDTEASCAVKDNSVVNAA